MTYPHGSTAPGVPGYAPSSYPPGYGAGYAPGQAPAATAPQIRNPFAAPVAAHAGPYGDLSFNADAEAAAIAQWHSMYVPAGDAAEHTRRGGEHKGEAAAGGGTRAPGGAGDGNNGARRADGGRDAELTVRRQGGGKQWEDRTLLEWDPAEFRIQVGNLAGEVTDESLGKAFAAYGVSRARVVRDKVTTKSRGYGFVAFRDPERGFRAAREMAGKYVGSHPVTIQRSKTDLRPVPALRRPAAGRPHGRKGAKSVGGNGNGNGKGGARRQQQQAGEDAAALRAQTGAHIEKKAVRHAPAGMKMLG